MLIHLTEKMRRKLHAPDLVAPEQAIAPHYRWYANLFIARRTQYILTTNAASRFSIVIPGRGMTCSEAYAKVFLEHLRHRLWKPEVASLFTPEAIEASGGIQFAKTVDRSVLGTMNDMVKECQFHSEREYCTVRVLSERINDMPSGALGWRCPNEAFAALDVG